MPIGRSYCSVHVSVQKTDTSVEWSTWPIRTANANRTEEHCYSDGRNIVKEELDSETLGTHAKSDHVHCLIGRSQRNRTGQQRQSDERNVKYYVKSLTQYKSCQVNWRSSENRTTQEK